MSCIFADGLAVGMGEYLSSKAHNKYVQAERRRQQYDYRNCRDEEMRSLVDLFKLKGMRLDDAELIVSKLSQYENLFVNLMMTERKGLLISEDTELELCTDAGVTFLSFALFGSLPLFAVLICAKLGIQSDINYGIALLLTSVMIIIFGFIRSTFR